MPSTRSPGVFIFSRLRSPTDPFAKLIFFPIDLFPKLIQEGLFLA